MEFAMNIEAQMLSTTTAGPRAAVRRRYDATIVATSVSVCGGEDPPRAPDIEVRERDAGPTSALREQRPVMRKPERTKKTSTPV